MEYLDFALALYPQKRRRGSEPYSRGFIEREEDWGLLKVLLGTTYKQLEEDLELLAAPYLLDVTTDERELVKVYRCEKLRWDRRYPETDRIVHTAREIAKLQNMCMECTALSDGRQIHNDKQGLHSNVLRTVSTIRVEI